MSWKSKKKITIVAIVIVAVLFLMSGWLWHWSRNLIAIENISGKTIKKVVITVCGQNYSIENLGPSKTKYLNFNVTGDSGFQFKTLFADNSKLSGNFGYVTGGAGAYNNKVTVKIKSNNIDFKQKPGAYGF